MEKHKDIWIQFKVTHDKCTNVVCTCFACGKCTIARADTMVERIDKVADNLVGVLMDSSCATDNHLSDYYVR